jgi:FMN reductase
MDNLIISCSLNPKSRSRELALIAFKALKDLNLSVKWLDLGKVSIPLCDGSSTFKNLKVIETKRIIQSSKGVLLAVPIYNYDVNAAAKNLIELTGDAWSNKVVGFLCAAGSKSSYMSVMNFANSLMLDFRCLIIPRFVYSTNEDHEKNKVKDLQLLERVNELTKELDRISTAMTT